MTDFFRFPHTPHIARLNPDASRDDKVLSVDEANTFLDGDVIVEEKIDGANTGFSIDDQGELRVQNRGSFLDPASCHAQFKPLFRWLAPKRDLLANALFPDLMLFGEWCYAVHSVRYSRLPDWFLAFDVYDRAQGKFLSVERRDRLAHSLGIENVPCLAAGRVDLSDLKNRMTSSAFSDSPLEGVYLRREVDGWLKTRAKLVRPQFIQAIGEHWSRRKLETNTLAHSEAREG